MYVRLTSPAAHSHFPKLFIGSTALNGAEFMSGTEITVSIRLILEKHSVGLVAE